jgi:hypothetical protein
MSPAMLHLRILAGYIAFPRALIDVVTNGSEPFRVPTRQHYSLFDSYSFERTWTVYLHRCARKSCSIMKVDFQILNPNADAKDSTFLKLFMNSTPFCDRL